jgi:hypothetical protein
VIGLTVGSLAIGIWSAVIAAATNFDDVWFADILRRYWSLWYWVLVPSCHDGQLVGIKSHLYYNWSWLWNHHISIHDEYWRSWWLDWLNGVWNWVSWNRVINLLNLTFGSITCRILDPNLILILIVEISLRGSPLADSIR